MQSSNELPLQEEIKVDTYEQWIQKSLTSFNTKNKKSDHDFDEKDHKIALEYCQSIYNTLTSICDQYFTYIMFIKLITTVRFYIDLKEDIHLSGCALSKKIKTCLKDLQTIDIKHIEDVKDSKWFYKLIKDYNVQRSVIPLINKLDAKINKHPTEQRPVLHI